MESSNHSTIVDRMKIKPIKDNVPKILKVMLQTPVPRTLITGVKVRASQLRLQFGDYVIW